ncbi:beta galactosidase jelly roll domain-containing protein [Mangrovivirga sp. M17]|uniref:Beta galactosidase jelly roll domain-containing protein n=1 Tax=Mangrovivirga halotolerans TaxID=2993936 RepID=A0ABT3RKR8_9BACT|nr:glycoside hydrolase family 2 TIM barrel-domain containing protein [Mangrovivirga halotolerans]MCX2742294.1 beta galactosidase jelly roll domain-containing protein [Mangrovivirga halotolerans]
MFSISDTTNWRSVQIPHTWNRLDPYDDQEGYYRGLGWYKKTFSTDSLWSEKSITLRFEGVNQVATVYLNNKEIYQHIGGYTSFNVPLEKLRLKEKNELLIKVDNSHDPDIIPLKGDFNFYGGMYRDIWILLNNKIHFTESNLGSTAVKITPEVVNKSGLINLSGQITNQSNEAKNLYLISTLVDRFGKEVINKKQKLSIIVGLNDFSETLKIKSPVLWSPENPYLYQLKTTITDDKGNIFDDFTHPVGFRYFRFDPNSGFYLNGKPAKLIGANRHQDYLDQGNAINNDHHFRDLKLLKEMGANFYRTAHYPQDPAVLEACDKLGLIVTMEIPLDHDITDSKEFYENSEHMLQEMIHQYYNHPSILVWAYMNEMFLGRNLKKDSAKIYQIVDFAKKLDSIARNTDPTRYTMIPNHGDLEIYHSTGLTDIPMIVGWNLYYGWYAEGFEGFTKFLNKAHAKIPDKPMIVTEYGAGADPRIFSNDPIRFDFSVDWESKFHFSHINQIKNIPFLSGAAVWNLFDFGSESRNDAVPGVNNKGLMTFDRKPKDSYFIYQSKLSNQPYLKILGNSRIKYPSNHKIPVSIVTNLSSVTLYANDELISTKNVENGLVTWELDKKPAGRLLLEANSIAGDSNIVDVHQIELITTNFYEGANKIAINAGSTFYFYDDKTGVLWLPDQEYTPDNVFGYVGGEFYRPRDRGIGTDKNIINTRIDPVYQTQNQGLKTYQINCPAGYYKVELLFSRLNSSDIQNLNILVNNTPVLIEKTNKKYYPINAVTNIYTRSDIIIKFPSDTREDSFVNGIKITKLN